MQITILCLIKKEIVITKMAEMFSLCNKQRGLNAKRFGKKYSKAGISENLMNQLVVRTSRASENVVNKIPPLQLVNSDYTCMKLTVSICHACLHFSKYQIKHFIFFQKDITYLPYVSSLQTYLVTTKGFNVLLITLSTLIYTLTFLSILSVLMLALFSIICDTIPQRISE